MNEEQNHMDHMLLPKATLKRFADERFKKIAVLNFRPDGTYGIQERSPNSFHTRNNYYDKEVDSQVMKNETRLGEWYRRISDCIKSGDHSNINFEELKQFVIRIITLQFHRSVLVDDALRNKFLQQKEAELSDISLRHINAGIRMPNQTLDYIIHFRKAKKNFPEFFQKNYLMNGNYMVEKTYSGTHAVITYIPEDMDATFLLPPQHYILIEKKKITPPQLYASEEHSVLVILSPKLAVGLYSDDCRENVMELDRSEVDSLVPRSVEIALEMSDPEFRQVVGSRSYLEQVAARIDGYKDLIRETDDPDTYRIRVDGDMPDNELECVIMLKVLRPGAKSVILSFPPEMRPREADVMKWLVRFCQYGYKVTVVFE